MNIYDIAKMADVSIATVSRVINNKPGVSDKAKAKVMAVLGETGFRPNEIAKSLTRQKTNVIGLVMPGVSNYFSDRIDAINKVCKQRGYSLMITANYKDSNSTQEDVDNFNLLFEKRVDGIIYFPTNVMQEHIQVINRIREQVPVVVTDKELEGITLPCVVQDFSKPMREVMNLLIRQGHERIAFINGLSYDKPNDERQRIYISALEKAGIGFRDGLVREGAYSVEAGQAAMTSILESSKEKPTAVVTANDLMAIGAMNVLRAQGLRIPQDMTVVGYDDIEIARYLTPALTTVRVNQYDMGKIAATMVIDLVEGNINEGHKVVMDHELILRDTSNL